MPSERGVKSLQDILGAIAYLREWVAEAGGADAAVYGNEMLRSAIERQLLVVSEAAIRLYRSDPSLVAQAPEINWAGIRGIGNVLRHRYDDIERRMMVEVLTTHLLPLEAACRRLLAAE